MDTSVYQTSFHIDLRDVDFNKELKLSTLFGYFQEAASQAVDELGIGFAALEREHGVAWALLRMRVDLLRCPLWMERVTVETWPLPPQLLEFERDFLLRDGHGEVIARASSVWVIFDTASRRLRKSETIAIDYPPFRTERALGEKLRKLPDLTAPETAYHKTIGYSDVDLNGHMNNTRYLDYCMDCFPLEGHRQYGVRSVEISYLNEALPGETLELLRDVSAAGEGIISIAGQKPDGKTAFQARVHIERRCEDTAH